MFVYTDVLRLVAGRAPEQITFRLVAHVDGGGLHAGTPAGMSGQVALGGLQA